MHITMPSTGGYNGGDYFKVNVTRSIVVLLFVRNGTVLLLRNASFLLFVCLYVFVEPCIFFFNDYACCRL